VNFLQATTFFNIDWQSFLLGSENWIFLVEAALRSFVMFTVILFSLRILGKRSITQLSVFELGVIIGLGSAAGDPMFYKDVGLLPGIIVFTVVISLYRLLTFIIDRSGNLEKLLEGQPRYLIRDGQFIVENFKKEPIAHAELFTLLRLRNVSHLGQIQQAIIEPNGNISVFYCADTDVNWGLPILPHLYDQKSQQIQTMDVYACSYCGHVEKISPAPVHICNQCNKKEWVKAINDTRIH
jgi:uncharacterized membrane protein YcaP (DUF421 family)